MYFASAGRKVCILYDFMQILWCGNISGSVLASKDSRIRCNIMKAVIYIGIYI